MKLPISWLKEYIDVKISPEKLADKLTMTGLEVEEVQSAVNFEKVVVGEVLERKKHPNADKLNVAMVRISDSHPEGVDGSVLQIVCGAPNLNVGQKAAVAVVGAKLGDFVISRVELRGVESNGMICSEKELELGEDHNGILVLDKKAKVGMDFAEYIKADKLLDIKIFANRPDLMGVIGLTREVAAALDKKFIQKELKVKENSKEKIEKILTVRVENNELCPRYMARVVKNVRVGESPDWMKKRLISCGVRPINNLVDISNYVMLEYGQPLHFFDLDKLGKNTTIIVRKAKAKEEMKTLDGVKRSLNNECLVIADEKRAIALAGVMGGENTEVDENTTNILIEAAIFEKSNIRKTSRTLGLRSEAVSRFEKGIPFELPKHAIDRAASLLAEIADGEIAAGVIDVKKEEYKKVTIDINKDKISSFLGVDISEKEIEKTLELLGFAIENGKAVVPWWRSDVSTETDLIEEIIRLWGYDRLPSTLPLSGSYVPLENDFSKVNKVRELLSNIGYTEILTYSFIGKKELENVGENIGVAPKLENPLVSEQEYMRTSLVPHMLNALRENQFNKEEIRFFEIGKTFKNSQQGILPLEERYLCLGLIGGKPWPYNYTGGRNYYELKGVLQRLTAEFSLKFSVAKEIQLPFKNGESAKVLLGGQEVGSFGEIDPKIVDKFDLKKSASILYINLDKLLYYSKNEKVFSDFSKYQFSLRDLSVIMNDSVEIGEFQHSFEKADKLIKEVEVVDIYTGKPLEKNQKSVTFRLKIQSDEKTLNESEIDKVMVECNKIVKKLGGIIRGAKES